MRIFLAGATGAIGRQLVPILLALGHEVTGTTRSADRAHDLRARGATAVVLDIFDAEAVARAVALARPDVVIHQLTALGVADAASIDDALLARNARIREEGTANLVAATVAAGVRRLVAQSIAWRYAPGDGPRAESDPLVAITSASPATDRGVHALERQVLDDARFDGLVLRYGRLYGPGTWWATPQQPPTVHVEAAAWAAALAADRGGPGPWNIVDDGGPVANGKARALLGWSPDLRVADARRPRGDVPDVPTDDAR